MAQNKINNIEELISNNNLKDAIKEIKKLAGELNGHSRKEISLIHSRLSELEKRYNAGIISRHDYTLEQSRISHSLYETLSHLKKSDSVNLDIQHNNLAGSLRKRILAAIIIAVLSLLIYWLFHFLSMPTQTNIIPIHNPSSEFDIK